MDNQVCYYTDIFFECQGWYFTWWQ